MVLAADVPRLVEIRNAFKFLNSKLEARNKLEKSRRKLLWRYGLDSAGSW